MDRATAERRVLEALVGRLGNQDDGWTYGYDLVKELRMPSGTFYRALYGLEGKGLVESRWPTEVSAEDRPRKQYRATSDGRKELAKLRAEDPQQAAGASKLRPGTAPA